jgi:hypothetical protein
MSDSQNDLIDALDSDVFGDEEERNNDSAIDWLTADPANFELAWPLVPDHHTNASLVFVQIPIAYADEADAFIYRRWVNTQRNLSARVICDGCAFDNNIDEHGHVIGECIPVRLVCSTNCFICGDPIDKGGL